MSNVMKGLRLAGALAMALAIAQCGDSNVHVTTGPGIAPSPGTFTGSLSDGGSITIQVGSIEAISFDCDDETISETFDPPKQVDSDGTFTVKFSDGGRQFRVEGTFRDNDHADGVINDEDNRCDVTFEADRSGGNTRTPTPARTPTGGLTATPGESNTVATETPTPTESGPTSTVPTVTSTGPIPTDRTPTPTPTSTTPTVDPSACPQGVEVVGNAGSNKVLDSGWTGLGHNATVVSEGKLTFTVSGCAGAKRPNCGTCNIGGPVQNLKADAGDINARRCTNDTSIKCTDSSACGSGTCEFFFGAPLPLAAGGINTCVVNQVKGSVSGTANVESGAFASTLNLLSKVYNQVDSSTPCPQCNGTDTPNDGKADGTCSAGTRQGQKCDVNGVSPVTSFGKTSLDCPPVGLLTGLNIALTGSSGTETKTLTASSPNCQANPSKKCLCPPSGSVPNQPNACLDDSSTPGTVEGCVPISQGSNKGQCEFNPGTDQFCSPFETFRGCLQNTDCPAPGDTCKSTNRPCFLDNGVVGGSVTAVGQADPPDAQGVSNPTFASLFCIPPVASVSINTAAGLPGLGRIELPLVSKEIQVLP